MDKKNPYDIIKCRHITEKASVLANLEHNENNPCVKRCDKPKLVFLVDKNANKREIAWAFEKIFQRKKVKVAQVNTMLVKPKVRRLRGRPGKTAIKKKAIITLEPGNSIEAK